MTSFISDNSGLAGVTNDVPAGRLNRNQTREQQVFPPSGVLGSIRPVPGAPVSDAPPKASGIVFYVLLGLVALVGLVGGAGYWSVSAKLDGAVIAAASFVVESNRKTVQHLEGGIVRDILVREGDYVTADQVLLRMDSTDSDIDVDVLGTQLAELYVRRARLLAELAGKTRFAFDPSRNQVVGALSDEDRKALIAVQTDLFDAQVRAKNGEAAIVAQRIVRFEEEIAGLEEQREANDRQLTIIGEELVSFETLLKRGLTAASRVNGIKREMERLRGADAQFTTAQARAGNQIDELKLNKIGRERERRALIATELAEIETRISAVGPQYYGAREKLKRVAIAAPVSGHIVNMQVYTEGGVIRAGEPILDIVPETDDLIVEARVATADIEKLSVGQDTRVRLTAFDESEAPEATGAIVDLSADSLTDERNGEDYFVARIRLDEEQPDTVSALEIVPGMPADVLVNTGSRTALSYFLQPLNDRLARTFVQ